MCVSAPNGGRRVGLWCQASSSSSKLTIPCPAPAARTASVCLRRPSGPSKCSSRSQSTVSRRACGLGMLRDARKKARYSLTMLPRSKKCSSVIFGPAAKRVALRPRPPLAVVVVPAGVWSFSGAAGLLLPLLLLPLSPSLPLAKQTRLEEARHLWLLPGAGARRQGLAATSCSQPRRKEGPMPAPRSPIATLQAVVVVSKMLVLSKQRQGWPGQRQAAEEESRGGVRVLPRSECWSSPTSFPLHARRVRVRVRVRPRSVGQGRGEPPDSQTRRAPKHTPRVRVSSMCCANEAMRGMGGWKRLNGKKAVDSVLSGQPWPGPVAVIAAAPPQDR